MTFRPATCFDRAHQNPIPFKLKEKRLARTTRPVQNQYEIWSVKVAQRVKCHRILRRPTKQKSSTDKPHQCACIALINRGPTFTASGRQSKFSVKKPIPSFFDWKRIKGNYIRSVLPQKPGNIAITGS
ncbi:hypothetical protein KF913_19560 [Candidatus Obscuribacterales bacterium]|nr:hypothetical protein [Candidatus Obscuribacterales bacterium]